MRTHPSALYLLTLLALQRWLFSQEFTRHTRVYQGIARINVDCSEQPFARPFDRLKPS